MFFGKTKSDWATEDRSYEEWNMYERFFRHKYDDKTFCWRHYKNQNKKKKHHLCCNFLTLQSMLLIVLPWCEIVQSEDTLLHSTVTVVTTLTCHIQQKMWTNASSLEQLGWSECCQISCSVQKSFQNSCKTITLFSYMGPMILSSAAYCCDASPCSITRAVFCVVYSLNAYSSDNVSPHRPDTSHAHPPSGEERPPPPYPSSSCHTLPHHFYPKPPPCTRPVAPGPESQPPASPPPPMRWSGFTPPAPPPSSSSSSSSSSLDINSNPKPSCLHFPKHSPPGDMSHAHPSDINASPLYIRTPLVLTRHDQSLGNPPSFPSSMPPPPPWAACPCARERGPPRLTR